MKGLPLTAHEQGVMAGVLNAFALTDIHEEGMDNEEKSVVGKRRRRSSRKTRGSKCNHAAHCISIPFPVCGIRRSML